MATDEIVNVEQEKIEKLEKQKEEIKQPSWWQTIPLKAWAFAVIIDLLIFAYMNSNKIDMHNIFWVAGVTLGILYLISKNVGLQRSKVLSPREARIAINKRIEEMYIEGTPLRIKYELMPWYKLMYTDVKPLNYYWSLIINDDDERQYGVAEVGAVGDTQGYVCIENLDVPFDAQTHYPNKVFVMKALESYALKQPGVSLGNLFAKKQQNQQQ